MPNSTFKLVVPMVARTLVPAMALTIGVLSIGCASREKVAPMQTTAVPVSETIDADEAAARALSVSPRVRASALRLDAARARATATALPPDPTIAISLGIPIDGLGGTAISASIMQGIGWLLAKDALIDAAARERDVAAHELIGASVETAAEARRLLRSLIAARVVTTASRTAMDAREARSAIERSRLELGETSTAKLLGIERDALIAKFTLNAAELEEHELSVSLASILAVDPLPGLIDADIAADFSAAVTSLEVIRARAQVARAEAMFASADSPLGADARAGGGFMRDLEGRESIAGTFEIGLPIFRRSFELQSLRADADAAHAELAEAERLASIENDHARTRVSSARTNLALAVNGVHNAQNEREITQRSHSNGEASLADLTDARVIEAEAQALCATRRREVADAIARLESRAFRTEADEQSRDRLQALSQDLSQEQTQPQTESSSGAAQ